MASLEATGGIDVLVNNAGIFPRSPALDMDEAEWDRVLAVNLQGHLSSAPGRRRG